MLKNDKCGAGTVIRTGGDWHKYSGWHNYSDTGLAMELEWDTLLLLYGLLIDLLRY